MDQTVVEEYKSSLNDLNFNSKPLINMLTMLADENKNHAALIVKTIMDHINQVSPEAKLPGLYLVDSIVKNLGADYMKIFCQQITGLFTSVFEKVDENTRSLMFKLRQTWTEILPNKVLYSLDVSVQKLDPAWPVTAKNPTKKILINPKFLDRPIEEKKVTEVPATSLKKEEDKIKQKQGEVLKQLLAKQEQLRQLELKKLQLTMKKTSANMGPNNPSPPTFKQSIVRDPRMVKINVSHNASPLKTSSNQIVQEKSGPKFQECANISNVPVTEKSPTSVKTNVPSSSANSILNFSSVESNIKHSDHATVSQKDNKNDKSTVSKNKPNTAHKDKISEDKCSSAESVRSINESDESPNKCTDPSKTNEKASKDYFKGTKISPKKKNVNYNYRKLQEASLNMHSMKKKAAHHKIQKRPERLKFSSNPCAVNAVGKKPIQKIESGPDTSSSDIENTKKKDTPVKLDDIVNKPKCVKTNDSDSEVSIKLAAHKDEDLRVDPMPLNEEANIRTLKREIVEHRLSPVEADKLHPPRKKIKNEDAENCNPDYRIDSPVLFGSEDQDHRQSFLKDVNSKDWTQYKEAHPDEYSPRPGRHENFGKFRFRKHQFPDFKYYYPSEYDNYGPSRHFRGRYSSRRNARRMHFPRGMRGRWLYNSPVASVMFDSRAFLRQAEEKFRCGRISETEYMDLRRDLQKMLESSEYQALKRHMPIKQAEHYSRFPETQTPRQEYEHQKQAVVKNLKIQKPSDKPLAMKTFFLDGKERVVHFIDGRAFVLLDNEEPRELTFKDELKKVLIDNTGEELTLCFDGKSVEFKVNGQRHIMRLGIPGQELYINNHPYAVQFGGPPLLAMLEDGYIYKIYLSGPAPQVVIGDKPEYEIFAKHHGKGDIMFKQEANLKSEEPNSQSQCVAPSSSTLLQDVDMRLKPESLLETDALINKESRFYIEGMKDVDWRQFPPPIKQESNKNPSMHWEDQTSASHCFKTWYKEDSNSTSAFNDNISNQSEMPAQKEPLNYDWKPPVQHPLPPPPPPPPPPMHTESNVPPPSSNQEMWYYKHNTHWESSSYRKRNNPPHPQGNFYEATNTARQQAGNVIDHYDPRNNPSHMSYSQRQPFQPKQPSDRSSSPNNRHWVSNTDREGSRHDTLHFSQSQEEPQSLPHRTLLPPPPFPPLYPFVPHQSNILQRGDDMNTTATNRIEPVHDHVSVPDSESHSTESATNEFKVDVESLLQKLIATGIINAKPFDEPEATSEIATSETEDKKENEAPSEEIPKIEFISESLKIHHPSVISAIHKGLQCATCGMRFKEMQSEQYSNHLDWHFRMNRREKDGAKKAISRRWYYEIEDWIQFEEFEDVEERVPSYFEMQAEDTQPEAVEVPPVISVPATSDDQECCPVCCERFQLFWVEEEEEWHYRNAVRHDNIAYHPACYEDFKKTTEAEALKAAESSSDELPENVEIINDVLNATLDDVCKTLENDNADEENHTETLETVEEVPPIETQSEEEILEGKPGEEEIIGVISESDIEMDTDAPKTESKMVVMQSGGITLKVKAESLQSHSSSNSPEKDAKSVDDKPVDEEDIIFRPPTPDPRFEVRPPLSKGRELSGLCCIM